MSETSQRADGQYFPPAPSVYEDSSKTEFVASYRVDSFYGDRTGRQTAEFYLALLRTEWPDDTFQLSTDLRSLYIHRIVPREVS